VQCINTAVQCSAISRTLRCAALHCAALHCAAPSAARFAPVVECAVVSLHGCTFALCQPTLTYGRMFRTACSSSYTHDFLNFVEYATISCARAAPCARASLRIYSSRWPNSAMNCPRRNAVTAQGQPSLLAVWIDHCVRMRTVAFAPSVVSASNAASAANIPASRRSVRTLMQLQ
jgi:hypothetical protein